MNLYLLLIEQSSETEESSTVSYITYESNVSGGMLPVFSSLETLEDAMKACVSASLDFDRIGYEILDPFKLAERIGDLEADGFNAFLFDPPPAPQGSVTEMGTPVPVGDYFSAIERIRLQYEERGAIAETSVEEGEAALRDQIKEWIV